MNIMRKTAALVVAVAVIGLGANAWTDVTPYAVEYDSGFGPDEAYLILPHLGGTTSAVAGAGSFSLDQAATISRMTFLGGCWSTTLPEDQDPLLGIQFYADDGSGLPGAPLGMSTTVEYPSGDEGRIDTGVTIGIGASTQPLYMYVADLAAPVALEANTQYWVAIEVLNDDRWGWAPAGFGVTTTTQAALGSADDSGAYSWTLNSGLHFGFTLMSGGVVIEPGGASIGDQLADLMEHVEDLDLSHGIESALLAKVEGATAALADDKDGNDWTAIFRLYAFSQQVRALSGKKIDEDEAQSLISETEDVILAVVENLPDQPRHKFGW